MNTDLTPKEKAIQLQAKIDTLTYIENYPCKCDKKKMVDLFENIKAVKWNYQKELEEING